MRRLESSLRSDEILELIAQIRRATRTAAAAMSRVAREEQAVDVAEAFGTAGFEPCGSDSWVAPGWSGGSPSIHLHHSAADRDAIFLRPIGWRDPASDGELLRDLLLEIPAMPTGRYALLRLRERDLVVFLEHLPTSQIDASEVRTALYSARLAGATRQIDASDGSCLAIEVQPDVLSRVDEFLLRRPSGWSRPARRDPKRPAWIRDGDPALAAHIDSEHGVLVLARCLRPFLGNVPLDGVDRLLRANATLLHGCVAALRDGTQGEIVLLQRICCQDLDESELQRSVTYLERLKIPWARRGRSALELLGALERAESATEAVVDTPHPKILTETERFPETITLGSRDDGEDLQLPVADLLTHAFVCGGTGSGKTIVCKSLLEELALAGVPSIVIDLKGDLSSLACVPNGVSAADIAAYLIRLYGDGAEQFGPSIARFAHNAAELYLAGELDGAKIEHLRARVSYRILTPRCDVGIPLSLSPLGRIEFGSIGASSGIVGNRELHEMVETNLRSLVEHLELPDADSETLVAVLTQLLESAHREGLPLDGIEGIETLVRLLFEVADHTEKIHFLPTELAIEPKQAERYARAMNARLGGTFRYWFDGEVLSIDDLTAACDERVPINIINLSMLLRSQDKAYAIAQVNTAIIEWMRRQPGAQRPRLVYCIDEIAQEGGKGAIYPPHPFNPITKPGLTVLLKQGRAFGVSCLLATQNAKDIDYKGLGQCDTWIVGRIKTRIDLERLRDGLEAAQLDSGFELDEAVGDLMSCVANLEPGRFLVKTRQSGTFVYRQRWIRSLHERLTPEMLRNWSRTREIEIDREVERAQELWNKGDPSAAMKRIEGLLAKNPYYTRAAETKLLLCDWLFRAERWADLAEYAAALRETVRCRSGFEIVHYFEGMANHELDNRDAARAALERFVGAAASGTTGELAERSRRLLQDLFVADDDYESLERSGADGERSSSFLGYCRAMKDALLEWPTLRGHLDDARVLATEANGEAARIHFARKGSRSLDSYVAEIQRRLGDLALAAPEVHSLSPEEAHALAGISSRLSRNEAAARARRDEIQSILADAESRIDDQEFAAASSILDEARKLVRVDGVCIEEFERVVSLYRGAVASTGSDLRSWLLGLDPIRFELETASLFRSLGYDAQATKASGDGGVDVFARYENRRFVIQCKRYRHPVAPGVIRELATAMRNADADGGILVATSSFSEGCRNEANRHDIQLIDLDDLIRLYSVSQRGSRAGNRKLGTNSDLAENVQRVLRDSTDPLRAAEVALHCGISPDACQPILAGLVASGVVCKSGRGRGVRYELVG